jgi:signal transduction histidine kinase
LHATFAEGRTSVNAGPIVLPPGNARLAFSFAPIRLRSQDGLRFRYRLDGFDKSWSPPTSARTADYTNLSSGTYRFRVQVFELGNPDSVSEALMEVVQKPYFYRTWWFITVTLLLILLAVFAAYRYRIRQVRSKFEAVLEERGRLAREMHDTVIQGCTGVSALLEAVSMEGTKDRAGILEFAGTQLRSTINEAREAIWNLRESDSDIGDIDEKIKSMTEHLSREFKIPVNFTATGSPYALSHPRAHDILMVAREAVFNALVHGNPSQVDVSIRYRDEDLTLRVFDNGCGFEAGGEDKKRHHFGLTGMRERIKRSGGRFLLQAAPGKGVLVEARMIRGDRAS